MSQVIKKKFGNTHFRKHSTHYLFCFVAVTTGVLWQKSLAIVEHINIVHSTELVQIVWVGNNSHCNTSFSSLLLAFFSPNQFSLQNLLLLFSDQGSSSMATILRSSVAILSPFKVCSSY